MGLFDKISKKNIGSNTLNFYFGKPEAEGESGDGLHGLGQYFEDHLNILGYISQGKFIVTGRKGAGKSAVAQYLLEQSNKESDSYCELIGFHKVSIERMVHSMSDNETKIPEEVFFEWLVVTKLIKLIVKNPNGRYILEYKKLKAFIEKNSGAVDIDKMQTIEVTRGRGMEVNFEQLHRAFPKFFASFNRKQIQAPFYKLLSPLTNILEEIIHYDVHRQTEYILLFDDLDINFSENDTKKIQSLTEFIRVVKRFNNEILNNTKSRILIFLRDDIKRILLKYNTDTAKIFSSYEVPIKWYDTHTFNRNENDIPLKKIVNRRIGNNFLANSILFFEEDPWQTLFDKYNYNDKSSFKYILDYTFYKPRDFILFLNNIGLESYQYPIQPDTIYSLIRKYAAEAIQEIKNELAISYSPVEVIKLLELFKNISMATGGISYSELSKKIKALSLQKSVEETIMIIIVHSYVSVRAIDGFVHYAYRNDNFLETVDFPKAMFWAHPAIHAYFRPPSVGASIRKHL